MVFLGIGTFPNSREKGVDQSGEIWNEWRFKKRSKSHREAAHAHTFPETFAHCDWIGLFGEWFTLGKGHAYRNAHQLLAPPIKREQDQ